MPLCLGVLLAGAALNGAQVCVEELYLRSVIVFALSLTRTRALSPLVDRKSRLSGGWVGARMFRLSSL